MKRAALLGFAAGAGASALGVAVAYAVGWYIDHQAEPDQEEKR